MGWLKIQKLEYLENATLFFYEIKKFLICFRWHILRSYHFAAEVIFKVKPLHIMLSKTSGYVRRYDECTNWIYFWLKHFLTHGFRDLLKKYNAISDKVNADIKKNMIASLSTIIFENRNKISWWSSYRVLW